MSRQLILVIEDIPDNADLVTTSATVVGWSEKLTFVTEEMPIGRLQIQGAKGQTR